MRTPEGKLKDIVKAELTRRGYWRAGTAKPENVVGWYYMPANNGYGVSGIPDFMGHCRGRYFSIETKPPGKGMTPNQKVRDREIRGSGGLNFLVRTEEDLLEALEVVEKG